MPDDNIEIHIRLYGVLREMYPSFHAFLTGQIPVWLAEHLEEVI